MYGRNNVRYGRHRRVRKRRTGLPRILGLIASITVMAFATLAGLLSHEAEGRVLPHPVEMQPGAILEDASAGIEGSGQTQSATEDAAWSLILANPWTPIPEQYEMNLVEVPGGEKVDERIYDPLMNMLEAAKEGNWDQLPQIVSGYRTSRKQQQLYDDKIAKYRQEGYSHEEAVRQAKRWVAVPGYSEHQLGLAVDINGATYDLYFWLQENSYKYGFIFRYPGAKTDITGTAEEVWHYRYVGVEAATEMYEQGICLEEYLEGLKESS